MIREIKRAESACPDCRSNIYNVWRGMGSPTGSSHNLSHYDIKRCVQALGLELQLIKESNKIWNWEAYCDLAETPSYDASPDEVQNRLVARYWCVSMQTLIDAYDQWYDPDSKWSGEEPIKART